MRSLAPQQPANGDRIIQFIFTAQASADKSTTEQPAEVEKTFARARSASDVLPEIFMKKLVAEMLKPKKHRVPAKRPAKAVTTLRLPPETLDHWKASGPGWQTRMAELLSREAPPE